MLSDEEQREMRLFTSSHLRLLITNRERYLVLAYQYDDWHDEVAKGLIADAEQVVAIAKSELACRGKL
jgi:hypothetical protein